jgi:hypothetical protein
MKIFRFGLGMWIFAFLILVPSLLTAGDATNQLRATIIWTGVGWVPMRGVSGFDQKGFLRGANSATFINYMILCCW